MADEVNKPKAEDDFGAHSLLRGGSEPEKVAETVAREGTRVPPPVVPKQVPPVVPASAPTAKPEDVAKSPAAAAVAADAIGGAVSDEKLAEVLKALPEDQLEEFTRRVAIKTREMSQQEAEKRRKNEPPRFVEDFSKVSELDIWNLNVPIQTITHEIPEFLIVNLKDANYSPRWIQTNSRRLGQAIAEGWTYVTREELAEDLKIEISNDASGHYVYADVVLMKLPKAKLFGRLRANFLKSLAVTKSQAALHEAMREVIKQDLTNSEFGTDYSKYSQKGAMNTYSPLVGA